MTDFGRLCRVGVTSVWRRCVLVAVCICLLSATGQASEPLVCPKEGGLSSQRLQIVQAGDRVMRTCYVMTLTSGENVSVPIILNPELIPGLVLEDLARGITFVSNRDGTRRAAADAHRMSSGSLKSHGYLTLRGITYEVFGPPYPSFHHEWVPVDDDYAVSVWLHKATARPTEVDVGDIKSLFISFYWHSGWVTRSVYEGGPTGYGLALETLFDRSSVLEAVEDMKRVMAWADVTEDKAR